MLSKSANVFIIGLLVIIISIGTVGCAVEKPVSQDNSVNKTSAEPDLASDPTAIMVPTEMPSPTASTPTIPTISVNTQYAINVPYECRQIVDNLYTLRNDLDLPEHFTQGTPSRQPSDFDPNVYFQIFSHLSIESGYILDYVYFLDELGGLPLVYARKTSSTPFQSYSDLLKSYGEEPAGERSYGRLRHEYDYLEKISIDKTPESYFEFTALAFQGNQYYLFWHALYNDVKILCDSSDLNYVYADMNGYDLEFPQDVINRIKMIDYSPVVLVGENEVTVRMVIFTKWGGFFENVYVMDKDNPMQLIDVRYNPIIEYDCGINF